MITLWTGLPGAGKTLNAIAEIHKLEGHRKVFYFGVEGLALDWTPLGFPQHTDVLPIMEENLKDIHGKEGLIPADRFQDLPHGSVVLIDEAYNVFPQRTKAKAPPVVEWMRYHRHTGIDIHLTAQNPMQIDVDVRRLITDHRHVSCLFGNEKAEIVKWNRCIDDPHERGQKSFGERSIVPYPKDVYDFYKSAEIHTKKARVPGKVYALFALIGVVILSISVAIWSGARLMDSDRMGDFQDATNDHLVPANLSVIDSVSIDSGRRNSPSLKAAKKQETASEVWENFEVNQAKFITGMTSLVDNAPWTSEFYASVFQAVDYPRPHCMIFGEVSDSRGLRPKCQCYSQQGTRLQVSYSSCRWYVNNGFFDPTRPRSDFSVSDINTDSATD